MSLKDEVWAALCEVKEQRQIVRRWMIANPQAPRDIRHCPNFSTLMLKQEKMRALVDDFVEGRRS